MATEGIHKVRAPAIDRRLAGIGEQIGPQVENAFHGLKVHHLEVRLSRRLLLFVGVDVVFNFHHDERTQADVLLFRRIKKTRMDAVAALTGQPRGAAAILSASSASLDAESIIKAKISRSQKAKTKAIEDIWLQKVRFSQLALLAPF